MKINSISIFIVEIPYKIAYKTSSNTTSAGRHIVVKIGTDDGIYGWGETGIISRRYPSQGDSPESMFKVIEHYLAPAILGMDPMNIALIIERLEKTIRGNYFAKCAIDHAIYDITGKALNMSVSKLLGGMHHTSFSVSRSLPLGTPKEVAERALILKDQGYKMLTLKGGLNYKNDIECFKATRKILGDDYRLEIDPNGGYDRVTAVKAILALEEYDIDAVEQPIKGTDIMGMAEVKQKVNTTIIADESVFTIDDLVNVINFSAADVICLKPFKSGGLFLSKKMQFISEAFNLPVSTGSMHPFGIGTSALHQFVSTISTISATGYGDPHERFIDDIVDEKCFKFEDGIVSLFEKPGLGIEVNLDKLEKYTKKYKLIS